MGIPVARSSRPWLAAALAATVSLFASCTVASAQAEDAPRGLRTSGFPMYTVPADPKSVPIAKAPAPFVHPRLLFLAEELPELRRLLLSPESLGSWEYGHKTDAPIKGAGAFVSLRRHLETTLYKDGDPYKKYYDMMLADNTPSGTIDLTAAGLTSRFGAYFYLHAGNVADGGYGYKGVYGKLAGAAFVALITEEEAPYKLRDLGRVLGATCHHHTAIWKSTDDREFGFFHDSPPDLGLAYDWLYNEMSNADRQSCRSLIGKMANRDRREFGAQYVDFPWSGFNWNW